jgi:arylsulfatase A-like enzyme
MWVNVWDPHTPYRTPREFGNPFAQDPIPEWYTEEVRRDHWEKAGPHSAREVNGFTPESDWMFRPGGVAERYPTVPEYQPLEIDSMQEARRMFDGYDRGVAYADMHVGAILQKLKDLDIYEDTAIIVSADHGENLGELWVYGDHQTADQFTHNIPMIVRWPGKTDDRAGEMDPRLMYNIDMAATTLEWAGGGALETWDGTSFADELKNGTPHRDALVLSQMAWCAQRSARWEHYICIESYRDGFHGYPDIMVFDLDADPHEQHDLSAHRPDLVKKGKELLAAWKQECLETSHVKVDPKDTVIAEGGPLHVRDDGPAYMKRLRETGRGHLADAFETRYPEWT